MSEEVATAETLGRFRKELLEQGFSKKEAFVLARDAASHHISERYGSGLVVKSDD